jgi:hypothetical protein
MSFVSDALHRANRDARAAEAFTETDHPWGPDLEATAARSGDIVSGIDGSRAHRQPVLDVNAARPRVRRVTDPARAPECGQRASSLIALEPVARQQITGLVERVFVPAEGEAPRTVAFAGIDTDALSAWITAAVADILAQRTAATIGVVEMNFANPRMHECFGIERTPGVVEALRSAAPLADSACQVRRNLWAIPAGEPAGPTELTTISRARIAQLATGFDHVVMNLEPLTGWCGGGLPVMADGIVLVIRADTTHRQVGRQVAERLHASGARMLGAVLTNRRYAIPEAIYRRL